MNKINQTRNDTLYDRYPEIFKEIKEILNKNNIINPTILSFGCSTGEEVKTLNEKYFSNSLIDGYDLCDTFIEKLNTENKNDKLKYYSNSTKLQKYDLIFCMSVLCIWPSNPEQYKFSLFEETLNDIDKLLNTGGYLCIYNSRYIFSDTELSKNYEPVNTNYKETGFVTKYYKDLSFIKPYPFYLFKKMKNNNIII